MPGLDRTGPLGLGPGTGRRRGLCFNPYPVDAPWYGGGRGRGMGRGWGMGMRWYGSQPFLGPNVIPGPIGLPEITPEQNIAYLEAEKKAIETQLAAIEKELERLKKDQK